MKKLTIILFALLVGISAGNAQSAAGDSILRKKMAVDYLEVVNFAYETAEAEAVANLMVKAFKQDLVVAEIDHTAVTNESDQLKLLALTYALNTLKNSPAPSWAQLLDAEKKALIEQDKALRRESKYKTK